MKACINNKREVINFLWGYGYDERPCGENEVEVKGKTFEQSMKSANDKELGGVLRYYVDEQGIVHRKTDEQIMTSDDYKHNEMKKKLEIKKYKIQEKLAWIEMSKQAGLTQKETDYINTKISEE